MLKKAISLILAGISLLSLNAQTVRYFMDSTITYTHSYNGDSSLYSMEQYTYDSYGFPTCYALFNWEYNTFKWSGAEMQTHAHDTSGNKVQSSKYYFNQQTQKWDEGSRIFSRFDAFGNETRRLYMTNSPELGWVASYKILSIFDEQGAALSEAEYQWDRMLQAWKGKNKKEYTNNSFGKPALVHFYTWDTQTSDWIIEGYGEGSYDSSGNLVLSLSYAWDVERGSWAENDKAEFAYDSSGKMILEAYYNWNSEAENWEGFRKYEYSYADAESRKTTVMHLFNSDTFEWVASKKTEYTFDDAGKQLLLLEYFIDRESGNWEQHHKQESAYNARGDLISDISYFWDSPAEKWIGSNRNDIAYNESGDETVNTRYYWDKSAEEWKGFDKRVYIYASNGDKAISEKYKWVSSPGNWRITHKSFHYYSNTYYFNEEHKICEGTFLIWEGRIFSDPGIYRKSKAYEHNDTIREITLLEIPKPASFDIIGPDTVPENSSQRYMLPSNNELTYSWYVENGSIASQDSDSTIEVQWGNQEAGKLYAYAVDTSGCSSDTASLYVSLKATGVQPEIEAPTITLYPNPVRELLTLHIGQCGSSMKFELFASSGDLLHTEYVSSNPYQLNMQGYPAGIYTIRITTGQSSISEKIVKTRR